MTVAATAAAWLPSGREVSVIVIGASAGGVEAISSLLPALPVGLQAAVCIVVHLPRGRESLLVDVFGRRCALPVVEAEDKQPLAPGTVVVAPPDYHLLLDAGPRLALSVDAPVHHSRPSIDVLFESAADTVGRTLMGVVLSGANADGADGLAAVRRNGGYTAVQSPESAAAPTMPAAALARGPADVVLPLAGLAALFASLSPAPPGDGT